MRVLRRDGRDAAAVTGGLHAHAQSQDLQPLHPVGFSGRGDEGNVSGVWVVLAQQHTSAVRLARGKDTWNSRTAAAAMAPGYLAATIMLPLGFVDGGRAVARRPSPLAAL